MPLYVGTSGWQYRDWRGVLYPDSLPQRAWLEHFAADFRTVEVNNAFYRLPALAVFERWRDQTPPGFVMAVKVSRYLTHVRRLRDPAEPGLAIVAQSGVITRLSNQVSVSQLLNAKYSWPTPSSGFTSTYWRNGVVMSSMNQ